VQLGDDGVEELKELLTIYAERNADPGAQPLWDPSDIKPVQRQEPDALRALVEAVWFVWREHGGKGHGARWDTDPLVQGPFVRLSQELFHQAGIKPPSARTLRRALQSFLQETSQELKAAYADLLCREALRRKRT
jgi:hypothetical protein